MADIEQDNDIQDTQEILDEVDAREYIYQAPLKTQDYATPWWPKLDGKLALRDVVGKEGMDWGNSNVQVGNSLQVKRMLGEMISRTLIFKRTGRFVFPLGDRDKIVDTLGITVLMPLVTEIYEFLGLGDKASLMVAAAKKNSEQMNGNSSGVG